MVGVGFRPSCSPPSPEKAGRGVFGVGGYDALVGEVGCLVVVENDGKEMSSNGTGSVEAITGATLDPPSCPTDQCLTWSTQRTRACAHANHLTRDRSTTPVPRNESGPGHRVVRRLKVCGQLLPALLVCFPCSQHSIGHVPRLINDSLVSIQSVLRRTRGARSTRRWLERA